MGDDYEECSKPNKFGKTNNTLPIWGNEQTMNLNPLILANIQGSSYFKVHLFKLKTYHEVVDEIYYQVRHLEPWERGSRKTAGQTGMCGGVRGVGAGGIVSTAYCLLYKLYTLRLTRKQLNGLLAHPDSPFIRALGFMYVRYTQPPADLLEWLEPYLEDEEALEGCGAGGGAGGGAGAPSTIGQLARHLLTKLDWFTTLFPRIPVPIQKNIQQRLAEHDRQLELSNPVKNTARYPRDGNTQRDRERDRDRDRERGDYRSDRDKGDRNERDRGERNERDRGERNERDRGERNERDRGERNERDRGDRSDRDRDRGDRSDKERDRGDRSDKERDRGDRDRKERDRHDRERNSDRGRERDRDRERDRYKERSPRDTRDRKHR